MNKTKKVLILLGITLMSIQSLEAPQHAIAAIPAEYRPNYKFAVEWDKIDETNRIINSKQKNGQSVEVYHFRELLKNYNTLFEYMPQKSQYKSVYQDCRTTTSSLAREYDPNEYTQYYNNCLVPLGEIFKEIANSNTVKAKITARPVEGAAPLTVTFDGRASSDDASKTTIPSRNYFWYYTDTNGVEQSIGNGPVVKHTFTKEGNYVINLTVRSANAGSEGVFDGSATVNVNVGPQAARLIVFANGRRLREELAIKFTSQEAADGIRIDGTATAPLGGRQIMKHEWVVTNSSNQIIFQEGSIDARGRNNGSPGSFRVPITSNGLYNVALRIQDNEGNTVESAFDIIIADPIATIKVSPVDGNTSSVYTFDASTSYSVQSTLRSYNWVITDQEGNEIISENEKSFQYKFLRPGTYRVRLRVIDQRGEDNEEAITLQVDSTPPVPQFTVEPTRQRQKPSEFILDASPTYDVDTKNGDALTYEWSFSNNDNVSIDRTFDDNKRILVTFREKGTYKATLTVKDNYNKIQQITKDIDVLSTLRPRFSVRPASVKLGENTNFTLRSNKNISNYKIDYGDGKIENSTKEQYTYRYSKVGMYVIKVTAYSDDGEENTISTNVFIGDADKPIPAFTVANQRNEFIIPERTCTDPSGDKHPAYVVERYQNLLIDGGESINVQGTKAGLIFYFRPQGEETFKGQQKRQTFDEVGCRFIDFTLEDTVINKTATTRIRFFVTNAKPTINNLVMSFPQVGNNYGIGIGQNANKDQFKDIAVSDIVVKVDAQQPKDSDGSISKFRWFYYNIADENRLLEIKYTPGNTPYTYFTVPNVLGEYRFGVEIYDNDGESTNSEELLGKGPSIYVAPSADEIDMPIVTLKIDRVNAKVGDVVTMEAVARIPSNRSDFATNSTFSYDIDGDGNYDLVTKDNKITWVYKNPGNYTPRVKVTYRGRSGIAKGEKIDVQKGIRAGYLYAVVGNTLVVRDTSFGNISSRRFCVDRSLCRNESSIIENQKVFTKTYEKAGKYYPRYEVRDENGNSSSAAQQIITIGDPLPPNSIGIATLPAADKGGVVSIGKNLENKILFYIGYTGKGDCFVDKDITSSSRGGERTDQDRDIQCNVDTMIEYVPSAKSTIARVYYQMDDKLVSKDITIDFMDFEIELTPEQDALYNHITSIMNSLGDNSPTLKSLLLQLRNTIVQGDDISSLVLQIRDHLENNIENIPVRISNNVSAFLASVENATTCSANGCSEYKTAKTVILKAFRPERKEEVAKLFEEMDNAGTPTEKKQFLDKILEIAEDEKQKGELDTVDVEQIQSEVCNIVIYFDIPGTSCAGEGDILSGGMTETPTDTGGSNIGITILKWIGIIVGVLGLGFIILVVIFALKAKKKQEVTQ